MWSVIIWSRMLSKYVPSSATDYSMAKSSFSEVCLMHFSSIQKSTNQRYDLMLMIIIHLIQNPTDPEVRRIILKSIGDTQYMMNQLNTVYKHGFHGFKRSFVYIRPFPGMFLFQDITKIFQMIWISGCQLRVMRVHFGKLRSWKVENDRKFISEWLNSEWILNHQISIGNCYQDFVHVSSSY